MLCIVSGLTSGKGVDKCRGGGQPREKFRRLKKVHMRIWEIFRGILKVYQNVADTEKSMKSGQLKALATFTAYASYPALDCLSQNFV